MSNVTVEVAACTPRLLVGTVLINLRFMSVYRGLFLTPPPRFPMPLSMCVKVFTLLSPSNSAQLPIGLRSLAILVVGRVICYVL